MKLKNSLYFLFFLSVSGLALSLNLASAYTEYTEEEDFTSQTLTWGIPPNIKTLYYEYTHEIVFRNSFNGWYLYDAEIAPDLDIHKTSGVSVTDTHSEADEAEDIHTCWAHTSVTGNDGSTPKTTKVESKYEDWYPLGYPWNGDWEYDYAW